MINSVTLIGRLTKDCDLRFTQSGKAVASFTVAVNGFKEGDTSFINCVVWDKKAVALADYTSKGSKIGVQGYLNTRTFEGSEGKTVYVTEVIADQIEFMDQPKSEPKIVPNNYQQNRR